MGIKKCVPKNIMLKCDKGGAPCPLTVINPTTTIHGVDIATEADKVFGQSFTGFGTCSVTGSACAATVTNWKYTTKSSLVCSGNKLLTNESELPCGKGGIITIDLDAPSNEIDEPNIFDKMQSKMNGVVDKVTAPLKELEAAASEAVSDISDSIMKVGENAIQSGKDFINTDGLGRSTMIGDAFGKSVDRFGNMLQKSKEGLEMIGDLTGTRNEIELGTDIVEGVGRTGLSIADKLGKGVTAIFNYGKEYWDDSSARFEKDKQIAKAMGTAAVDGVEKGYYEAKLLATDLMEDTPGTIKRRHASAVNYTTNKMEDIANFSDWYMNEASDDERADVVANGTIKFIGSGVGGGITKGVSSAIGAATNKVMGAAGQTIKATVNQANNTLSQASGTIKGIQQGLNKKKGENGDVVTQTPDKPKTPPNDNDSSSQQANQNQNKNGTACKPGDKQTCKDDPVDIIAGVMFYPGQDFEIPGIIPFKWERTWYSDSKYNGALGHGFHHSYDIHLTERNNDILLILSDGRSAFFPILTEEISTNYNRTEKLTLSKLKTGNYELLEHKTQLTYLLQEKENNIYRLTKISNIDDIHILFQYENNVLSEIVDTAGRIIEIQSNSKNHITKIDIQHKNNKRHLVSYEYSQSGNLIDIIDPIGKSLKMKYKNHLMISKTDRNGQTFYWEYEGIHTGAKCIHTWGDGGILEGFMEYYKDHTIYSNAIHGQSIYYHKNGLCIKEIDSLGGELVKEYNEFDELIKSVDEEGNITLFDYDDHGNMTSVKYADNAIHEYTYDEKGKLQIITRPQGGSTIYAYKEEKLDTIIQPDGMMTTFEYTKNGLISTVYDNIDSKTQLFYDDDHNLIKMIFPNQAIYKWEYNEWGQSIKAINPHNHTQEFEYDIKGRVTTVKLPDQNTIKLQYNAYEDVIEAIDKDRNIAFEYTPLGSLKTRTENGSKVYFQYNSQEELIGIINEHKESYKFSRNTKGDIIREEGFDGLTRKFIRDRAGKVLKVEGPNNNHSIYEYDKGGRISRIEHQDGTWATYSYNKDGLLIEAVNPNSHVKINRDEAGRILSENQDGYTVVSEYGELGIRTGIKSSLGADINFEHSILGEVTKMNVKTKQNNPWEANYQYNSLGMETERALPGGIISSWDYGASGNPEKHRITANGSEQQCRLYSWDVNSKLQRITNNLTNKATRFSYDDFNSLASAEYEDGSYDYKLPDEVGNLYKTKDKKDQEYGKSGKLLRSGATYYHYDEEGNLIEKNTPKGSWKYNWEAVGMLQSVTKPDKTTIEFEYDALGRRTAKKILSPRAESKDGEIVRWIWDGNVPLHEWQYDLKDRPKAIVDELGNITKDKKEPVEDLITWIFDQGTFRPAAKITVEDTYSIITDYLGTPVEMYNSKGEKTWHAEYDIYGKVRKLVIGSLNDCPFRYQGQYEDIEIGLYYNRFRYYAPDEGVYISQDPIGLAGEMPNFYTYVRDTNSIIDVFGLSEGSGTLGKNMVKANMTHGLDPFVRGNFQAHHVIPHEVWTRSQDFFKDIGLGGAKDKAANGIFLPKNATIAEQYGFDNYHRGSHEGINIDMENKVSQIKSDYESGIISKTKARKKISAIQKAERNRLSSRKGLKPTRCS
ncbi:DUF6531 domain-containing protein [Aquimarina rubra]|uniref:DUF6531 domain-containing protein n=1 Tax=Aquimarina rubra TaxID=1920033 RepID=A0ABW5LCG1_9FLAO